MNRPGPVGITILLTFLIVAVIELRTLLAMVGIDVSTQLYFPAAAAAIVAVVAALVLLPEGEQSKPTKA
jgi:hypothetical protein